MVAPPAEDRPPEGAALDVVARLRDHQQNLEPPATPARAVFLALPRPPIARVVLPERFAELRARWLSELRAELGGGDGALETIDLESEERPLAVLLAELAGRGIATLFVHGGRDQPGFARAVLARWSGRVVPVEALSPARASLLAPWLDSSPASPASPASSIAARSSADPIVSDLPPEDARQPALAPDPERRVAPWSGFVPPAALFGTTQGEELRSAWTRWWSARGLPDAVRCAVLGLDPALEARLQQPARSAARSRCVLVAVTGLDGAGKSTHAQALARSVVDSGRTATLVRIYRHGAFLELANELGARTHRGAPLAAFRASRLVKLVDSLRVLREAIVPLAERTDALIFDRYVETHLAAAASQLGWRLDAHPFVTAFPRADHDFFLRVDPEAALARLRARDERLSADEHEVGLLGYARELERLASGPGRTALDAAAPLATNAAAIDARVRELLGAPQGRTTIGATTTASPLTSPASPPPPISVTPEAQPASPRLRRCRVAVGRRSGIELGLELLQLRRFLAAQIGPAIEGVPESTWLEAWCAQLLLELRIHRPDAACVALWPEALARMPSCRDLVVLPELARMLEAEAEPVFPSSALASDAVAAEDDRVVETFRGFGASERGARRLALEYGDALRSCAREAT